MLVTRSSSLEKVLRRVVSFLGGAACENLRHWVHSVWALDDNPWWSYKNFLSQWGAEVRRNGYDPIDASSDALLIAEEIRDASSIDDADAVLQTARKCVLSQWDQCILESRGLSEIPAESNYFPLVDEVANVIRMSRFQQYFPRLLQRLGPRGVRIIEHAVRASSENAGKDCSRHLTEVSVTLGKHERKVIEDYARSMLRRKGAFIEIANLPRQIAGPDGTPPDRGKGGEDVSA